MSEPASPGSRDARDRGLDARLRAQRAAERLAILRDRLAELRGEHPARGDQRAEQLRVEAGALAQRALRSGVLSLHLAADAHERAAEAHERAAAGLDGRDDPSRANHHRRAAETHRLGAEADRQRARAAEESIGRP